MEFEKTSMNLWAEYLKAYFNGQTHSIQSGQSVSFPSATLGFQQTVMPAALEGAHIAVVLSDPGSMRQRQIGGAYQGFANVLLDFYIRAQVKATRSDGVNAESLARKTSDCLFALLCDRGASIPLQSKGITKVRPRPPRAVMNNEYAMRVINCSSQYLFLTPASFGASTRLGGD